MKRIGGLRNTNQPAASTVHLATSVLKYTVTYHTGTSPPEMEERYVRDASRTQKNAEVPPDLPSETVGAIPAYETLCDAEGARKKRQNVAHMYELKAEEAVFLRILLSLNYSSQLLTLCGCRTPENDCVREKHDFCRVMKNASIKLGHFGLRCPDADLAHTFTLVDSNGIHASAITLCRCKTADGQRGAPAFQQLLQAGIFPGSVKDPRTGYTLGLLEYYHQLRSQGKGSSYDFVLVLQCMADSFFADAVPDITKNFLAIIRFHQQLDIIMRRGHAHGVEDALPGEADRPYLNRPPGYLGLLCAACPERGVNMPLTVNIPNYLRHLISLFITDDGNFKANLFYKRDNGSDKALTDGRMYFPAQNKYDRIAAEYVVHEEDKEVPCKVHIGSIRHQGSVKYGNTAVGGVIACACDHAVIGSFIDMLKGEAFALVTYSLCQHLKRLNSPPHGPASTTPMVISYDSWCSCCINNIKRAVTLFLEETWLHTLLALAEGQIPADHINGHRLDCQAIWQAVYFACRAHFHGETAEVIWVFLNGLAPSTRQSNGAAWHDIMNYAIDTWNWLKVLRQAQLLADERLDALWLFELHMAVVEDLSKQHVTEVAAWSQLSRLTTKSANGKVHSVYQHELTKVLTIENFLAAMLAEEHEKSARNDSQVPKTWVAKWIHDGMSIQRQQYFVIVLLQNHREHPLEETWATITKLRDALKVELKKFRETQRGIYPWLKLSALDADEPELTAIQLPSYRMKHGQRVATDLDANDEDSRLREAEIKLRCSEATSGILAVRAASLALSAVKKARDLDYRGQAGVSPSLRNLQKAQLMKTYEIAMYNRARDALVDLGHMAKDAEEPYAPLDIQDTQRKETHLHRAKGDSCLFDRTAWYLQSGTTILRAAVAPILSPPNGEHADDDEPRLLAGTQTLKRSGFTKSGRAPKRLKDIAPDDVKVGSSSSEAEDSDSDVDMSPSTKQKQEQEQEQKPAKNQCGKKKEKKTDSWIWLESLTRGRDLGDDKMLEYKRESDRVQWFHAEAEMYRWLEQYERKHAELMRVIERYRWDGEVWTKLGDSGMYKRLEHNARVIFKNAVSGAHHDWVSATTYDELVIKIDQWRDVVFKWMDNMIPARHSLGVPEPPPMLSKSVSSLVPELVVAQPPCLQNALEFSLDLSSVGLKFRGT
ncbi:hypothetical protein B0H10DRAFT_2217064 [Mycena sp. CBHHK59/15]|nr:hypothetical protein B0H10DRAFT_2217064 [Mycena sp. CBHHK59/15]